MGPKNTGRQWESVKQYRNAQVKWHIQSIQLTAGFAFAQRQAVEAGLIATRRGFTLAAIWCRHTIDGWRFRFRDSAATLGATNCGGEELGRSAAVVTGLIRNLSITTTFSAIWFSKRSSAAGILSSRYSALSGLAKVVFDNMLYSLIRAAGMLAGGRLGLDWLAAIVTIIEIIVAITHRVTGLECISIILY